ncbi:hypothetical protein LEP1GSC062_0520 [Leptospira alexanderi serovar Manhao 3 str. L 60]|uniref:Uncharacterized protein n=1 Tax=Leptospira alexanderi serovar Manhao 3 str. L 60 TaxID=1049759 RepID=V6I3X4_9LEPT|nr:hypothetical protein LEP1GSC062_0520 [Leptospira alexanderi serovar Manhao 3 str. L 60]
MRRAFERRFTGIRFYSILYELIRIVLEGKVGEKNSNWSLRDEWNFFISLVCSLNYLKS